MFTMFVPVERGRNALQFTYLMTSWRHNSVTIHVTKFYFIQLVLKIKYVEFEDKPNFFIKKTLEMWQVFCQKTDKRIFYLKIGKYENWTTCCKSFEQPVPLKEANKIYQFTLTLSPHYLVKLKRRISSTFLKSTITVRSIEPPSL